MCTIQIMGRGGFLYGKYLPRERKGRHPSFTACRSRDVDTTNEKDIQLSYNRLQTLVSFMVHRTAAEIVMYGESTASIRQKSIDQSVYYLSLLTIPQYPSSSTIASLSLLHTHTLTISPTQHLHAILPIHPPTYRPPSLSTSQTTQLYSTSFHSIPINSPIPPSTHHYYSSSSPAP